VEGVSKGDDVVGDDIVCDDIVGSVSSVSGDEDGEGVVQARGENRHSSSSLPPLNTSSSHLHFLVYLAGEEEAVWDRSVWGTDVGASGAGGGGGAGIIARDSLSSVSAASGGVLALMASLMTKSQGRQWRCLAAWARI
jgi:hypothetical protein